MGIPLREHADVIASTRILWAWVESKILYSGVPGCSMGIVYDQELIWSCACGFADRETKTPATPRTIYRIASITKLFTSTAIMQLRDAGKLQLDDPVKKHLEWFTVRNRFPDSPVITIRQLLTHTSGLPRESPFPYWTDYKFPSREDMITSLANQETSLPSETKWKYSNLGLAIAGEIISAVSGESYADYIHNRILSPLGMHSTSVILPEEHRERLATGYGRRMPDNTRLVHPFTDAKGITPAANMSSTVEDMAKFISLQFRYDSNAGNQILKGSTMREMHRVHWLEPDWKSGRGIGFGIYRLGERIIVGHGGHVGGYCTQVRFCPQEKIGIVVMTNADDAEPLAISEQSFKLVAPSIKKALTSEPPKAETHPEWEIYTGKYRNRWEDSEIMILNNSLYMVFPQSAEPRDTMVKLVPEGEAHIFRIEGEAGGMEIGESVKFEIDEQGTVKSVRVGDNYTFPRKD